MKLTLRRKHSPCCNARIDTILGYDKTECSKCGTLIQRLARL